MRPLVWWWCAANFSADWLLKFAELFGIRTLILSQLWQPSRWPISLAELDGEKPDIPGVPGGVMFIGEQTRRLRGALRTSWTFEGIGGDGKNVTFKGRGNSIDFSFEPGFSQVSIIKHPNWKKLKETWGAQVIDGQVIWPEFVSAKGGGGPKKDDGAGQTNPLFGHDDFFRVEGTYSFRYAAFGYGGSQSGVGLIATSLPGNPPPVQDGRNWLKAPSPVVRRGLLAERRGRMASADLYERSHGGFGWGQWDAEQLSFRAQ